MLVYIQLDCKIVYKSVQLHHRWLSAFRYESAESMPAWIKLLLGEEASLFHLSTWKSQSTSTYDYLHWKSPEPRTDPTQRMVKRKSPRTLRHFSPHTLAATPAPPSLLPQFLSIPLPIRQKAWGLIYCITASAHCSYKLVKMRADSVI